MVTTNGSEPTSDPAVLAAEIEQTRAELAGTLDAIAEKVSPKRVAKRTKQKVADSVREGAASAKVSLVEGAAAAKEVVKDKTAKVKATPPLSSVPDLDPSADQVPMAELPPVGAIAVPTLAPTAPALTAGPTVNKEYVVGGVAVVVLGLLLLLLRRRRR